VQVVNIELWKILVSLKIRHMIQIYGLYSIEKGSRYDGNGEWKMKFASKSNENGSDVQCAGIE
jgi:hypothetical protein